MNFVKPRRRNGPTQLVPSLGKWQGERGTPPGPAGEVQAAGTQAQADADSGMIAGLDFKGAINAHVAWKVRLEKCINGTSEEDLQVEMVSA